MQATLARRVLHTALALFFSSIPLALAQQLPADWKPVKLEKEVLLPPDSDELGWRWGMKLASFGPSNNGTRDEFHDYETIERRIKELSDDGYNAIICNGLHFHLCFLDRWEMWQANMAKIVEVAHKHGMRVVEHYDVPVIYYAGGGYDYLVNHLDWLQRDIRYGYPSFHAMCLNNPGFRREYLDRLEHSVRRTKVDAVMLDECSFAATELCGCRYCRKQFTKDSGCVLPEDNSSEVFFDRNCPLWVTWLKWRIKSMGDWWVDVRKTLNKVNPHMSILVYTTHAGLTHNTAAMSYGSDIFEKARACDFLGTEIMARNVFDCCRAVFAFRKLKSALGTHFSSPIFGLVYHLDDEGFAYFGWALCHMNGQTTWMSTIEGADMKRYINWPYQMDNRRAESVADIALLFSTYSRDWNRLFSHVSDAMGYSQCLSDAHIQHDFVLDDDITAEKLKKYKLLILPSCGCMSAGQVEEIEKYVSDGGAIIVSGHTSLFDEDGFGGENFQLASVIGVDYEQDSVDGPFHIMKGADPKVITYPIKTIKVKVKDADRTHVVADIVDKKNRCVAPAIVVTRHGKGKSVYLAPRLGGANFEPEQTIKTKWTFEKDEPLADLLLDVVRMAVGGPLVLEEVNIPDKVFASAYRQDTDGKKQILVHLLNATGVRIKKGDTVPTGTTSGAFPALENDIVFDLRTAPIAGGYIVSPDYPETRKISVQRRENDAYRITVNKRDLKTYAILYLAVD